MRPGPSGDNGLEPFRYQGAEESIPSSTEYGSGRPQYVPTRPVVKKRTRTDLMNAVLLTIIVLLSICIVGVLARALVYYNSSHDLRVVMGSGMLMMAWPSDRQYFLLPTYLLLSAAVISAAFAIFALVWIFVMSKKATRMNIGRITTIVSAVIVIGMFVAALTLFKLRDGTTGLYGWSCQYRRMEHLHDDNEVGLGQVCISMAATWYLGIAVGALELIMLVILVRALTATKSQKKRNRGFMPQRKGYANLDRGEKGESDTVPMIAQPVHS